MGETQGFQVRPRKLHGLCPDDSLLVLRCTHFQCFEEKHFQKIFLPNYINELSEDQMGVRETELANVLEIQAQGLESSQFCLPDSHLIS